MTYDELRAAIWTALPNASIDIDPTTGRVIVTDTAFEVTKYDPDDVGDHEVTDRYTTGE